MQTTHWVTQGVLIAQSSADASNWIAPVIALIVLLLVVGLAVASRRNASSDLETPDKGATPAGASDPHVKQHTTDLAAMREQGFDAKEIEAILAKPRDERTMGEVKRLNLAKNLDPDMKARITADEATRLAQEEHAALKAAALEATAQGDEPPQDDEPVKVSEEVVKDVLATQDAATKGEEDEEDAAAKGEGEEDAKSFEDGLNKTRDGFSKEFFGLFKGKEELNEDLRDAIEEFLYTSDIGSKAATRIMAQIDRTKDEVKRDPSRVWEFVRRYITEEMLVARESKLDISGSKPFVMLVVGVNGAGKTTTIGKLASRFKRQGKSVLVVAGDTFRAAAVEQLEVWTERVDVPIHKGKTEADPASVVFDGIERGVNEDFDVILCDTSGRLHTDVKLMDELRKIERVSGKAFDGAPHETVLVLDANSGQNAVVQAKTFGGALDVTGLILTKLDGTARGGVIMGIGEELDVPVRFVGIGEGIKDLREFDAREFADALFL